jgi:hypothetical protein
MITMKRLLNDNNNNNNNSNEYFYSIVEECVTRVKYLICISITDLDQKCPQKIIRTYSNDLRCVQTYCNLYL